MKIRFIIDNYNISVTENNWDSPFLARKGDRVDIFDFLLNDRGNIVCPIEALDQINRDNQTQYTDYIEYFAITRFRIEEFVWIKESEGIYCEVHLVA